jgi:hypothetical protein
MPPVGDKLSSRAAGRKRFFAFAEKLRRDEAAMGAKDTRAKGEETGVPRRPAGEAARAYLDLWERQLVQLALHGPAPAGDRPPT